MHHRSLPDPPHTVTRSRTLGLSLTRDLRTKVKTEKGMKKEIRQVWDEVDLSLLHNLIQSIPDRLRRIRKAEGGSIKAVN